MYFARVGIYQFKPAAHEQAIERAKRGLTKRLDDAPGFVDYTLVVLPDGRGISLSLWETRRDAIRAVARVEEWVRDNIGHLLSRHEAFVGEVGLWVNERFSSRVRTVYATAIITAFSHALSAERQEELWSFVYPDATLENRATGDQVPLRDALRGLMQAFSDIELSDVQLTVQDDRIFLECEVSARHTGTLETSQGPLLGSGQSIHGRVGALFVTNGERIADVRLYIDRWSFIEQLGSREFPWNQTSALIPAETPRPL